MTLPNDPDTLDDLAPDGTTPPATDVRNQQSPSGGEDWETRYKGQQKVMGKKDTQIARLQEQLESLTAQIEELKPLVDTRTTEKQTLETTKATLEQELLAARAEAAAIKQKLAHTGIIMQDFPMIAPLSDYVPESADDAAYRKNAENFSTAVQKIVDAEVKRVLAGSAPTQPKGTGGLATSTEEDALYRQVVALAGRPGKEAEFEEANNRWIALQQSKMTR